MKLNLYFKAFLASFLPGFFLYLMLNYEKPHVSIPAFLVGLVTGITLLFFALLHHLLAAKKTGDTGEAMKVRHQRDLDLKMTDREAFNLFKDYALEMNYKIKEERTNAFLLCKTPFSLKTFGTLLSFEITSANNNVTHVKINTAPWISTTIIDFGDSLDRIQKAEEYLKKR